MRQISKSELKQMKPLVNTLEELDSLLKKHGNVVSKKDLEEIFKMILLADEKMTDYKAKEILKVRENQEGYIIMCQYCNHQFAVDHDTFFKGEVTCPNCKRAIKRLYYDI